MTVYRTPMPPPTNKAKPWRVIGPGEQFEDRPSETKAYELVRSLLAEGHAVTVYVYAYDRWNLFEHLEPHGDSR